MLASYHEVDSTPATPAAFLLPVPQNTLPHLCVASESEDSWFLRGCTSAPVVLEPDAVFNFESSTEKRQKQQQRRQVNFLQPIAPSGVMDIVTPEDDLERITKCVERLKTSGYFYEGLSWQQASMLLRKCEVGTFLVRESENPNYLFTLSVQTKKGPTSIRIAYNYGKFWLDSEDSLVAQMPRFETVTDLVEHYIRASKDSPLQKNSHSCVWLDLAGVYSAPVEVYKPLYKNVHRLKHLSRLAMVQALQKATPGVPVHKNLSRCKHKDLPSALREYIEDYPHSH